MSGGEETVRLRHMLDHAREAVSLVKGKTRDDLDSNRLLNLALVRLVEIVGEAAARFPRERWSLLLQVCRVFARVPHRGTDLSRPGGFRAIDVLFHSPVSRSGAPANRSPHTNRPG